MLFLCFDALGQCTSDIGGLKKKDELERLLLQERATIERLEADLAHADAGHQAIVRTVDIRR
jgi:hypothetical protein